MTRATPEDRNLDKNAMLSECGNYRYALWRSWDSARGQVLFICLNPSTADVQNDDPTLRRCIRFAKEWGYGSLAIGNLFAFRTPSPKVLRGANDPVGPETDRWLRTLVNDSEASVVAWGNHGSWLRRDRDVLRLLPSPECLGVTKKGCPRHPLYLKSDTPLVPYRL